MTDSFPALVDAAKRSLGCCQVADGQERLGFDDEGILRA